MLGLDVALAEIVQALAARGLRSVLLKGPAIASWLYDEPSQRTYGDIDLLVDPMTFDRAEAVVAERGFASAPEPVAFYHSVWRRGGRVPTTLELHHSLYWTRCPEALVWSELSTGTDEIMVAGTPVAVLGVSARLLLVSLHAAQHGRAHKQSLADLERALNRVEPSEWKAAAQLSLRLGAIEPFGAGLRLHPAGTRIADALAIPLTGSRELMLRLATPPDTAMGVERLASAAGMWCRLRLLAAECVPSPEFMRIWQPLARRGRLGLALAYLWRPLWLLSKAPAGFRAWRQANTDFRATDGG